MNVAAHAEWRPLINRFDTAVRAFYRAQYRHRTALAANLADPKLHALAMARIQGDWAEYMLLLNQLSLWASYLGMSFCNPSAPNEQPKLDDGSAAEPEACDPFLKGVRFSVKVGAFLKFALNCEQMSFEVASKTDILWVGLFAEGSFNFVKGTGTIFAGAKAGAKIPETGIQVSAKEGFYLTVGSTGFKDVGMRVSTSGAFGLLSGPAGEMKGFGYDLSFASQTITF